MNCPRCEELRQQREEALRAGDGSRAGDCLVLLKRCCDQGHPEQLKRPEW